MGLAAPQIGVNRCAAVVQAPDQAPVVRLQPPDRGRLRGPLTSNTKAA
jgi:peptide deformylase